MSKYAAFRDNARLSEVELAGWRASGAVQPAWRLATALLCQIQEAVARLVLTGREDLRLPHVPLDGDEEMDLAREFFDYVSHPDLLDLAALLLGPDLVLWDAAVVDVPAEGADLHDWQLAAASAPLTPPSPSVSLWIAVTDLERASGFLQLPASGAMRPRECLLEGGQILVYDAARCTPQGAGPEALSEAGLLIRYMPASSHYAHAGANAGFATRPIWLVRGHSRCALNDFDLGHTIW